MINQRNIIPLSFSLVNTIIGNKAIKKYINIDCFDALYSQPHLGHVYL